MTKSNNITRSGPFSFSSSRTAKAAGYTLPEHILTASGKILGKLKRVKRENGDIASYHDALVIGEGANEIELVGYELYELAELISSVDIRCYDSLKETTDEQTEKKTRSRRSKAI